MKAFQWVLLLMLPEPRRSSPVKSNFFILTCFPYFFAEVKLYLRNIFLGNNFCTVLEILHPPLCNSSDIVRGNCWTIRWNHPIFLQMVRWQNCLIIWKVASLHNLKIKIVHLGCFCCTGWKAKQLTMTKTLVSLFCTVCLASKWQFIPQLEL